MGSFSIFHWLIVLLFVGAIIFVIRLLLPRVGNPEPGEIANTWKFRTVVFVILAFIVPLWLITLPLFLYLAYRSYVAGAPAAITTHPVVQQQPATSPQSKTQEIAALHNLLSSGALTQDEFESEKKKLLGAQSANG